MERRNLRYKEQWRDTNSIQTIMINLITTFLTPFILVFQRDYIVLWNVILFSATVSSPEIVAIAKLILTWFVVGDNGDYGAKHITDDNLEKEECKMPEPLASSALYKSKKHGVHYNEQYMRSFE